MGRSKESIAYLDTHILVWLYAGLTEKLTEKAGETIEKSDLLVSQFSRLEIQYLYEIGRITAKPATILKSLARSINLRTGDCPIEKLINAALNIEWTRDLFDRLLISEVKVTGAQLITADKKIRSHFENAVW